MQAERLEDIASERMKLPIYQWDFRQAGAEAGLYLTSRYLYFAERCLKKERMPVVKLKKGINFFPFWLSVPIKASFSYLKTKLVFKVFRVCQAEITSLVF